MPSLNSIVQTTSSLPYRLRPAQLDGECPGDAIETDPVPFLELKRRIAVRMCRHQIGGPERDRENELAAIQDRPRLHRSLARATGACK